MPAWPGCAPRSRRRRAELTFVIEARNVRWNPDSLTVSSGDTVTLVLFNNDCAIPHTFELPQFGVSVNLSAGAEGTATFTANPAGTYQFWCGVPGHAQLNPSTQQYSGMVGTLVVQAPRTPGIELSLTVAVLVLILAVARRGARRAGGP